MRHKGGGRAAAKRGWRGRRDVIMWCCCCNQLVKSPLRLFNTSKLTACSPTTCCCYRLTTMPMATLCTPPPSKRLLQLPAASRALQEAAGRAEWPVDSCCRAQRRSRRLGEGGRDDASACIISCWDCTFTGQEGLFATSSAVERASVWGMHGIAWARR